MRVVLWIMRTGLRRSYYRLEGQSLNPFAYLNEPLKIAIAFPKREPDPYLGPAVHQ